MNNLKAMMKAKPRDEHLREVGELEEAQKRRLDELIRQERMGSRNSDDANLVLSSPILSDPGCLFSSSHAVPDPSTSVDLGHDHPPRQRPSLTAAAAAAREPRK
jgi:hypothetical protein